MNGLELMQERERLQKRLNEIHDAKELLKHFRIQAAIDVINTQVDELQGQVKILDVRLKALVEKE